LKKLLTIRQWDRHHAAGHGDPLARGFNWLVDEYGRAQKDPLITPSRKDIREHSASLRMPDGGPLKTPCSTSVRVVDAMGHEVEELSEQNDSEDTVTEVRYSRHEALQHMKRAVADLQDGLRGVDT
jgi:hypothetical protein